MSNLTNIHYFPIVRICSKSWDSILDEEEVTWGPQSEHLLECIDYLSQQRKINKKKYHKTTNDDVTELQYEIVQYADDGHGTFLKNRCIIYLDEMIEDESDDYFELRLVKVNYTMNVKKIISKFKVIETVKA